MTDPTALPRPVVDVWWARTGCRDTGALAVLLDRGERDRFEALRQEADRERFVLAATLVRTAVADRLGVPVTAVALDRTCPTCGKPHGRPRLAAPDAGLELSITHSGRLAGVAVGDRGVAVGLDVEAVDGLRDLASLEHAVLAGGERRALDRAAAASGSPGRTAAFLKLWTRKEALTKMVGLGITVPLAEVVVSGPDEPARCLAWPGGELVPGAVSLHDLEPPVARHVAALAAARPAAVVRARDGTDLLATTP